MHHFVTEMCTYLLQDGALWDMKQMDCGICEMGLLGRKRGSCSSHFCSRHDDVIKWKHFSRYWPFVRGIHRFPVNSPHKGQWRGALMFSLICTRINGWVNNGEAGDLRRYRAHCDVTVVKPVHRDMATNTEHVIANTYSGLILGLLPANERRRHKVTPSLIDWAQS